jgi:catechol 2,3-dioxygenase-like lactoylglutathione lyase family enzyme
MAAQGDHPEVGRVHLNVADLERAQAFYRAALGLSIAGRSGDARVYLTADGRRQHVVLHAIVPGGDRAVGQARFSLRYPDRQALASALRRLDAAGVTVQEALDDGLVESLLVVDPDGHRVEIYCERLPAGPDGPLLSDNPPPRPLDLQALRAFANGAVPPPAVAAGSTSPVPPGAQALTGLTRERLREMRVRLLNLHKVLLDDARAAYELDRGLVRSNVSLLQLVINDPWFAWLHPLSELVVRIDEVLQPDAPATEADAGVLLEQVAALLTPASTSGRFAERYYEALQRQPAVIMAHAEVRRILKEAR